MADQDEWRKKAFDYASDTAKQIITLSTGILALTITFAKDILGSISSVAKVLLMLAWLVYLFSIAFGLITLFTLTGTLDSWSKCQPPSPGAAPPSPPSIYDPNIARPAKFQILSFLAATFLIFLSGGFSTCGHAPNTKQASPTASPSPSATAH